MISDTYQQGQQQFFTNFQTWCETDLVILQHWDLLLIIRYCLVSFTFLVPPRFERKFSLMFMFNEDLKLSKQCF